MRSVRKLLSDHPLLWALPLVVGVMVYFVHSMAGIGTKTPRVLRPIDVVRMVPVKLSHFHGCPNPILASHTMSCVQENKLFQTRMTIRCKVTGDVLTTDMVRGIPFDFHQFEIVPSCPGVSVILWKPARIAFGVRHGRPREPGTPFSDSLPIIELMSRDPGQIIKLMCGDAKVGVVVDSNASQDRGQGLARGRGCTSTTKTE